MLVGVIHKKTLAEVAEQAARAESSPYGLLELRLDGCEDLTPDGLAGIALPLPAIFTLRPAAEGGYFTGSEAERLDLLERLAALKPAWIDVEASVPPERIARIRAASPGTRLILSSHDFAETPSNLDAVLDAMRGKADGAVYKIAAMSRNTPDALRMLLLCKKARSKGIPVIGVGMGEYGECTRVLAPVYGFGVSYCPLDEATAPGQLDADTFEMVYNFSRLGAATSVYGLLGDPVAQSVGHLWHNRQSAASGHDSVYVKWRSGCNDIAETLALLAQLGVSGLSVTMPLKEAVMPLLMGVDAAALEIGAVNTLKLEPGGYCGTNTDAAGALDALPVGVKGAKVAVIGAGGAARAFVYEALRRGAVLSVYNRTPGKTMPGGVSVLPLDDLAGLVAEPCDIMVNTLPFDADFDFGRVPVKREMFAYDISYAKKSRFLELAGAAGCRTLDGSGMFEAQAVLQRRFWGMCGGLNVD